MSDPKVIYLAPACNENSGDGRDWCADDVFETCECGSESVRYVIGSDFDRVSAERDALQADLDANDQRVDELEGVLRLARQFVVNGIDLGYIKMPDVDTPDPAHDLVPKIDAVLNPTPKPHTCCSNCPAGCIGDKP